MRGAFPPPPCPSHAPPSLPALLETTHLQTFPLSPSPQNQQDGGDELDASNGAAAGAAGAGAGTGAGVGAGAVAGGEKGA